MTNFTEWPFLTSLDILMSRTNPSSEVDVNSAFAVKKQPIPKTVGRFRFSLAEERWKWSAEVAALHGYTAREMTPTTATVLSHVHHDDRGDAFVAMSKMAETPTLASHKLRIVDVHGVVRHVVLLGNRVAGAPAHELRTAGLYIDITDPYDSEIDESVAAQLHRLTTAQPQIEQAKGMLMVMYGVPASQALDLLAWRSQDTGIDVQTIAERLIEAVGGGQSTAPPLREQFDNLLLTLHTQRSDSARK